MPISEFRADITKLKSCKAKLGEKDAYNDGDGVVPDALIILHDAHPLQRHKPAVRVAVHHLRAHVLHPQFRARKVKFTSCPKMYRPISSTPRPQRQIVP